MSDQSNGGKWLYCHKCNKKLAKRLGNGLFVFQFGRQRDNKDAQPRVKIEINGDMRMKCINVQCGAENIFNKFPNT